MVIMNKTDLETKFHNLLNQATSIRNLVYLILMEKVPPDKETKNYLQKCLENCNQLTEGLQQLRRDLKKTA